VVEVRRREFLALLGVASAWRRPALAILIGDAEMMCAPVVHAQQRIWRLGWLTPNPPPAVGRPYPDLDTFKSALAELGYTEGRNYLIDARFADTDNSRLPALAEELIADDVDIIVTIGTPTVAAAKSATTTIPIVMSGSADPVEHGLVVSLRNPGGNITGFTHSPGPEFAAKGLELLKEAAPSISRVAVLVDSSTVHEPLSLDVQKAVATKLGLTLLPHDVKGVRSGDDIAAIFSEIMKEGADALFVYPNFVNGKYASAITSFASASRLPAMYQDTDYTDIGGLISYYTNWLSLRRRAAFYVDKIIKGTKPADLPVEEPTTFELVVNLKAAKALGLSIPPSILTRADKVIE
jgi:putative ABC transport system substrate-binding protein